MPEADHGWLRSRARAGSARLLSRLLLGGWLLGSLPSGAQAPVATDSGPLRAILAALDRGDTAGAERLLTENLPQMPRLLEGVFREIDQEFDDLGRYGATSYRFGPGYEPLVAKNRRYQKLFELYNRRTGDETLFKRFEARRLRVEGADYTNRGEITCGETLDWPEAEKLYRASLERLEGAFALAQELQDLRVMASAKNNIGSTLIRLGKPAEALQAYSDGLRYAEQMPGDLYKGLLRLNLGNTYVWIGEPDQSLTYLQPALAIFKKMGRGTWEANALMTIGNAYLRQQKFAGAWETLQLALEVAKQSEENRVYGRTLLNLGMAGLQLKKKEALSLLEEALDWYEKEVGKEVYVPIEREAVRQDGLRLLSQVAQQAGDDARAERYMKQFFEAMGPDPDRYQTLRQSLCYEIYQARPVAPKPAGP